MNFERKKEVGDRLKVEFLKKKQEIIKTLISKNDFLGLRKVTSINKMGK